MGETPQAAMAGTASCMAASSMFPCSQSTMIQSGFALARALDTLAPGIICQIPKLGPSLSAKAARSLLDFCIAVIDAMLEDLRQYSYGLEAKRTAEHWPLNTLLGQREEARDVQSDFITRGGVD